VTSLQLTSPATTQKNTVYALARLGGVGAIEEFALRMARNFVDKYRQVTGSRQEVEEYSWNRISTAEDGPHDYAFTRGSAEVRTTVVTKHGADEWVISGLWELTVLKTTGSEFHGFPEVEYTSLVETADRILATAVTVRWRYIGVEHDWDKTFPGVRQLMLDRFASTHSLSLQQTLYAMGEGMLSAYPEIAEIRFSMPSRASPHPSQACSLAGLPVGAVRELDAADVSAPSTGRSCPVHGQRPPAHTRTIAWSRPNLTVDSRLTAVPPKPSDKHHFLVDLSKWGLDNPHEIWYAADRPYGLIEASIVRDDAPAADGLWEGIKGFV